MTDQSRMETRSTVSEDYGQSYYENYYDGEGGGDGGVPYTYEEPHWQQFFGGIADELIARLGPKTSYDAGCAKGFLVRSMAERGVDARGGDISEHAIEGAPKGLRERLEVRDLTEPFTDRFDLITCIEVLEHMSLPDARVAIANICAATDLVLMSSTPGDFAEPTHVNVRPVADWVADFAVQGFIRRTDIDASFVAPWAVLFERSNATTVTVVHSYESLLAPLNAEVVAKRRALLEAQRDVREAQNPVNAARAAAAAELAAMTADRDALEAERMRLVAHIDALGAADLAAERMNRLAMADELVGLRAEVAQVKVHAELSIVEGNREAVRRGEVLTATLVELDRSNVALDSARQRIADLTASNTWRVGRLVLFPLRLARLPRRVLGVLVRKVGRPQNR